MGRLGDPMVIADLIGQELVSEWRTIEQARIDEFAHATDDPQWIHTDPEKAAAGPFGTTIAHGNLTLSMVDGFRDGLFRSEGFKMGVNYGWNKIRFPAPVPSGTRIRASLETVSVDEVGDGWYQLVQRWTVEAEGNEKPVCVAESVVRLLA